VMGMLVALQFAEIPMTMVNAVSITVGATALALMFFALADWARRNWWRTLGLRAGELIDVSRHDDAEVTIASDHDASVMSVQAGAGASAVHQK